MNIQENNQESTLEIEQDKRTVLSTLIQVVTLSMAIFHLYTGIFGIFQSVLQRSAHVGFAMLIAFLMCDARGQKRRNRLPWYDACFIALILASVGYVVINAEAISSRFAYVTPLSGYEIFAGSIGTLLLLEAARRTMGLAMPIIAAAFIVYVYVGPNLPGILGHQGFTLEWTVDQLFYTTEGIWGIPAGVSATFIIMFVIFAAFLEKSKGGDFFIDLAMGLFGQSRGGPAKAAIIASGFMGMLSGSAVANVVTTGSFTIPLMKKLGYRNEFAGGVEAVASSGGQFMPPIMGAAAFIVAEFIGVPYIDVAIAAILPAALYYIAAFSMVHFEALRIDLKGLPKEELPNVRHTLIFGVQFIIPMVVLIGLLVRGYSPMKAGIWAILITILVSWIRSDTRMTPSKIIAALQSGVEGAIQVAIACATAGIVIGVLTLTGLGMRFNSIILSISDGNLLVTLILTMLTSILLGMGLPTVAAYIIQASLTVPVLISLGVMPLAAHFFIFYFAIISAITPPVALAAYAAAGISGGDPMKTTFTACKLGIAAFLVPYLFVYSPALLMVGSTSQVLLATVTAITGVVALGSSAIGFLFCLMTIPERALLLVASLTLIKPGLTTDMIGVVLMLVVIILNLSSKKKRTSISCN